MLLHSIQDSPAWRDLSGNAVKLLLHLMKLSEGNNGWGHKDEPGELFLGEREASEAIGVSRNTASRAFQELIDHGFLRVVRAGHFQVKVRLATVWRLTFEPYPRTHQGPTNDWRAWTPPEKKSREQKLNGTGSISGHKSESGAVTGAEIDPVKIENGENPPIPIGSKFAPHLDVPEGVLAPDVSKRSKTGNLIADFADGPSDDQPVTAEQLAELRQSIARAARA